MEENNKNRNESSDRSTNDSQHIHQNNQVQHNSDQTGQDQNPQRGSKWNNYQTRELSDEGSKEESGGRQ